MLKPFPTLYSRWTSRTVFCIDYGACIGLARLYDDLCIQTNALNMRPTMTNSRCVVLRRLRSSRHRVLRACFTHTH